MFKPILEQPEVFLCFATIFVFLSLPSCKKTDVQQEETISPERIEALRNAVANSTGAPLASVEYQATTKSFIVSQDAIISLKDAQARFSESAVIRGDASGSQQRVYTYTVARANASNIVLYADASVPAEWLAALDQSIINWNSTNSLIHMSRATATTTTTSPKKGKKPGIPTTTTVIPPYNVLITTMYNTTTNVVAQAYYPGYTGTAGHEVDINTYYNYLNASYKVFAITHELGHVIGFTHTDQTFGSLIAGTPEVDPNSVMNSFILPWAGFTGYDFLAVNTVYPK